MAAYLRKRITEDQFDAYCIDCQNARSDMANVTFGTFLCHDCAVQHENYYSQFQCYIKPLFDDSWDKFQLSMIKIGGNKRFFEFMRDYGKEREPINKKYENTAAAYYRRMMCAQAKNKEFPEPLPAKSITEGANKALASTQKAGAEAWDSTSKWASATNEKYQISQKTSEAATATKAWGVSLWGRAKAAVNK